MIVQKRATYYYYFCSTSSIWKKKERSVVRIFYCLSADFFQIDLINTNNTLAMARKINMAMKTLNLLSRGFYFLKISYKFYQQD